VNWDKIKNWIFGGAGAVALVIFYQFMQWQVSEEVSRQLASLDIATDAKIIAMDKAIDSNARTGEENEEDIEDLNARVLQAFEVLLGRD
jgi:hypothetical protein